MKNYNHNYDNNNNHVNSNQNNVSIQNKKSKIVAGLLALFLGGLGIHKFYLNQGGSGIVMLLFSWTLIPAIVAFFQAVNILTMTDQKFDQVYN